MSSQEEEVEINNFALLEGVGPQNKKELKSGGFETVFELAACIPEELMDRCKLTEDKAKTIIESANKYLEENKLLDIRVSNALEELERRDNLEHISLNSSKLDELFNGGIEVGAVTELAGEFGSGKSQISMMAALKTTLPKEQGGLDGNVIYIDTEGTFRPKRIKSICENLGYDWKQVLQRILVIKVRTSAELILEIKEKLLSRIEELKAKLVVIDSIISLFRAEKIGRGTLAARQQSIGSMLHKLGRTIEVYKCACIITNQVMAKPDGFNFPGADPTIPTGGNVLGHFSTYRVKLRKSGAKRIATMIDSPEHDYLAVPFSVTAKGIEDFSDESKKAKQTQESKEPETDDQLE